MDVNSNMNLQFAPMQGYADGAYRRIHATLYGGVDCYYTPFIRVEKGAPRRQDIERLKAAIGDGTNLVPQIILGDFNEFNILTEAIKSLGLRRIDLNLGCPYPMQTGKGRGSAMIVDLVTMGKVRDAIIQDTEVKYSVKMRLGWHDAKEWQPLIPLLNDMPLHHLTLHPRIAKQMYSGELLMPEFEKFFVESHNPLVFNGEIRTIADINQIKQNYPALSGIMIGRGLLARPSLGIEYATGEEWPKEKRLEMLREFHSLLFTEYKASLCGDTQLLQKIKPFWDYLESEIGHRAHKAIRKASILSRYFDAISII